MSETGRRVITSRCAKEPHASGCVVLGRKGWREERSEEEDEGVGGRRTYKIH